MRERLAFVMDSVQTAAPEDPDAGADRSVADARTGAGGALHRRDVPGPVLDRPLRRTRSDVRRPGRVAPPELPGAGAGTRIRGHPGGLRALAPGRPGGARDVHRARARELRAHVPPDPRGRA